MDGSRLRATWLATALLAVVISGCAAPMVPALVSREKELDRGAWRCDKGRRFADWPAEVVVHDELLWVRGAHGALASLDLRASVMKHHFPSEVVVDMHRTNEGVLWALTFDPAPDDMRVWARTDAGWTAILQMGSGAEVVALTELAGRPVVLTERAVFSVDDSQRVHSHWLSEPLRRGISRSVAVTRDGSAYVGINRAEFGGGLQRVDIHTGEVRDVQRLDGGGMCPGPLNRECHPVTSLIVDPVAPDCVLAGVGRRFHGADGRVLSVCGDRVSSSTRVAMAVARHWTARTEALARVYPAGSNDRRRLLELASDPGEAWEMLGNYAAIPPRPSPAVYALATNRDGYLAATSDAVYRVDDHGVTRSEIPGMRDRCGVLIGLTEDALVVPSVLNWAAPHGGRIPLVASRHGVRWQTARKRKRAPCDGAQLYYAWGYSRDQELAEFGYGLLLSCHDGVVSVLERGRPSSARMELPREEWDTLWMDLERANWRSWRGCETDKLRTDMRQRFVITTRDHTLRVACPAEQLKPQHEAFMQRIRHMAERARR
jgi:hypothetical protein